MRIHVGAAAIFDDKGRVLCCKRDSSSSHPGKWEFPGGKVEPDEKISDCIVRELNEELNLEIIPIRKLVSVEHSYGSRNVSIHLWHCTLSGESQSPELRCHSEVVWLHTHEMVSLDWLEADLTIVDFLQNYNH